MEKGAQNLLSQIGSQGILWIPSIMGVLHLLSMDNQGGYGVVCKVCIQRFNHIPNTFELVRKTFKTND
jgi:hypothetical protein